MKKSDINKPNWYNPKIIIIIISIIAILGISIAYSVLIINMKIHSNVSIKGTNDMKFIGIENISSSCGHDKYNPKNTDNIITINGELPSLECTLEYRITLINNTDVTMQIVSINDDIYSNQDILYEINGLETGNTVAPDTTVEFTITFRYKNLDKLPDDKSIGAIFEFTWNQYIPRVPTIILDTEFIEIEYGSNYDVMQGVKAIDFIDGDITSKLTYETNLDLNVVGEYVIAYFVTNSFEESTTAIKKITIVDRKKPTITLSQTERELLISDQIDLKSLVSAHDEYDGDITNNITISSAPSFSNQKAGTYIIYYNVTDSSHNTAEAQSITVTVFEFIKVSSGVYHSLALTSHGKVYAWGQGTYGQLGQGNTARITTPTLVPTLNNIVDIAAGEGSSFAVTSSGSVYAWGYNYNSRLGLGDTSTRNVPTVISTLSNEKIIEISSTSASAAALTEDGRVYTWGYGGYGALGTGSDSTQTRPVQIDINSVKSVKMGWYHGGALKENGDLYLWGTNLEGQMATGTTTGYNNRPTLISGISDVKSFSCGGRHTIALTNSGDLYAWGYNDQGQLGDNSITTRSRVVKIMSGTQITSISAGYNSSVASDEQGTVYSWGYNIYGKLGLNDITRRLVPTTNPYVIDAKYVEVGNNTSFIITKNSKVFGMGYNTDGAIGDGTTQERRIPTLWDFNY